MRADGGGGGGANHHERFRAQVRQLIGRLERRFRPPEGADELGGGTGAPTAAADGGGAAALDDGDLNAVDEAALARAKEAMSVDFERNRKRIGDEGFVYDVVVDFDTREGPGDWDSSDDDAG